MKVKEFVDVVNDVVIDYAKIYELYWNPLWNDYDHKYTDKRVNSKKDLEPYYDCELSSFELIAPHGEYDDSAIYIKMPKPIYKNGQEIECPCCCEKIIVESNNVKCNMCGWTVIRTLCKEIGNNYGEFFEENNQLCINNGEKIFRYNTEKELLVDWIDTLIEETLADGIDWNNEIEFIVLNCNHKIKGVRVFKGKTKTTYMATIDVPKGNGKTNQLSCGTYSTIIKAIKERKKAEANRQQIK